MLATWIVIPAVFLTYGAVGDSLPKYRLPTTLTPVSYSLTLDISKPEAETFGGTVLITFETKEKTNKFPIHVHSDYIKLEDLKIIKLEPAPDPKKPYECNAVKTNEYIEAVEIQCNQDLANGQTYKLSMNYKAKYTTEDMEGFYKSKYDGEEILLATQFEPTFARRVFPCFDEPAFKATFDISITHPKTYSVLSNTKKDTMLSSEGDLTATTKFVTTPKMSTYLVAFVMSNSATALKFGDKAKYDYKVIAKQAAQNNLKTANNYGPKLIDTMGKWIGIEYNDLGNEQIYQVAIPDFAAGAMENWGLITYREANLLDEGENTAKSAIQRIITVIAHELSHQWFGDYVTTDWWSNVWLNEGFATYFQYHLPSNVLGFDEDLELEKQFITMFQEALKADSQKEARPLSDKDDEIQSLEQIQQKFDDISYSKGASVIRMISEIMGAKPFKDALKNYLQANEKGNGSPDKLFQWIKNPDIWNTWIKQAGYPLVTASLKNGSISLKQEPFITISDTDSRNWQILISYTCGKDPKFDDLTYDNIDNIKIKDENQWVLFNLKGIGFYRVNYDEDLWNRIIKVLKGADGEKIDVLSKAQLIDDIYNIAKIGKVSYDKALDLTEFLKNEKDYYPWQTALKEFNYMLVKLDEKNQKMLKSLIYGYMQSAFKKEVEPNKHIDYLKNALIKEWYCKLEDPSCINEAKKNFEAYLTDQSTINKNYRGLTICYGLKHSSDPVTDIGKLQAIFVGKSSLEQNDILAAVGCSTNRTVLDLVLGEAANDGSVIRKQDALAAFTSVYSNTDEGMDAVLDFLANNFEKVNTKCKSLNSITRLVTGLAKTVKTNRQRTKLEKILKDNKSNAEISSITSEAKNSMDETKNWVKTHEQVVADKLSSLTKSSSAGNFAPMGIISIISIITLVVNLV